MTRAEAPAHVRELTSAERTIPASRASAARRCARHDPERAAMTAAGESGPAWESGRSSREREILLCGSASGLRWLGSLRTSSSCHGARLTGAVRCDLGHSTAAAESVALQPLRSRRGRSEGPPRPARWPSAASSPSRSRAAASVMAGEVRLGRGSVADKPGQLVADDVEVAVARRPAVRLARRDQARQRARRAGVDVEGRRCARRRRLDGRLHRLPAAARRRARASRSTSPTASWTGSCATTTA